MYRYLFVCLFEEAGKTAGWGCWMGGGGQGRHYCILASRDNSTLYTKMFLAAPIVPCSGTEDLMGGLTKATGRLPWFNRHEL